MLQQTCGTAGSPAAAARRLLHVFALELSAHHHALLYETASGQVYGS